MFRASAVFPMLGRAARIDELARLEPAGDVVEVEEAGGDARDRVLARSARAAIRSIACVSTSFSSSVSPLDLVLGDGEDLALGRLPGAAVAVKLIGIAVADDLVGALDQLRG